MRDIFRKINGFYQRWKKDICIVLGVIVLGIWVLGLENFLLASLAFAAIYGDILKNRWAGPRLGLIIQQNKGHFTYFNVNDGTDRPMKQLAIFYHMKLVNARKHVPAKKVRVLMSGSFKKQKDGSFLKGPLGGPIQMQWVPAELHNLDPFPTVMQTRSVDLGYLGEGSMYFVPGITWRPNNFQGNVARNQVVRYTFDIDAENFTSKQPFCVEVSWDGRWEPDIDEMTKHLLVKEIEYGSWAEN